MLPFTGPLPDDPDSELFLFQPDDQVAEHLIELMINGKLASGLFQMVITDIKSGRQKLLFINWPGHDLDDVVGRLYLTSTTEEQVAEIKETFFWFFWRGWAGTLDANIMADFPNADDELLAALAGGQPLRDALLRKLQSTLVWGYADALETWGSGEAWRTGQLFPGHLALRNDITVFIGRRMVALHGTDYETTAVG